MQILKHDRYRLEAETIFFIRKANQSDKKINAFLNSKILFESLIATSSNIKVEIN